jgi:DNA-binding NtrC family response regulator
LYYRVNVARIHLPPLRERRQDIPGLVAHFLELLGRRSSSPALSVEQAAMTALQAYDWPGNVRELRNIVESAIVFHTGNRIALDDLPAHIRYPLQKDKETSERSRILDALTSVEWNKSEAARILHCSRMTLYRKMTRYRIVGAA